MQVELAETPKPFGLFLSGPRASEASGWSRARWSEAITEHSFVVVRGLALDDEQFVTMVQNVGRAVEYGFGKVLNMEARTDARESQFTHAAMALHQDAILNRNNRASFLFFKCKQAPARGGGETLIANNRAFMRVAPRDLLDELRSVRIAYRALSAGYYDGGGGAEGAAEGAAKGAIEQPTIVPHPRTGEETLYIGLDDEDDPHRNFRATVVGYGPVQSRELMERVNRILRRPDVLHAHAWQPGDVLALDNYLVCHGRNAFTPGDCRRLLRVVSE